MPPPRWSIPTPRCARPATALPFEEGARLHWMDLDAALAGFAAGRFDDMKTEIGLRRLKDYLAKR